LYSVTGQNWPDTYNNIVYSVI